MKALIWSNQQRAWWRAGEAGYTQTIEEAGRYELVDAQRIVASATVGGRLSMRAADPVTGDEYDRLDEYVLPAPESLAELAELVDAVGQLGRMASARIAEEDGPRCANHSDELVCPACAG